MSNFRKKKKEKEEAKIGKAEDQSVEFIHLLNRI